MSAQAALVFIQHLRASGETVPERIAPLVEQARAAGYVFSKADLRAAFKADWAMRWAFELRRAGAGLPT